MKKRTLIKIINYSTNQFKLLSKKTINKICKWITTFDKNKAIIVEIL